MSERPAEQGARLAIKHTTRWARAILDEIVGVLDVETFEQVTAERLALNDLARVRLRLSAPLLVDPYGVNRATGAFILVDEATNETVGAGMVSLGDRLTHRPSTEANDDVLSSRMRVEYREEPCRSALNRVKGMPFKWSLNPYMGCAHRCTFCYVRAFERGPSGRPTSATGGRSA